MSNRVKTKKEKLSKIASRPHSCPKCKSTQLKRSEYDDATLYVCGGCGFPERVLK